MSKPLIHKVDLEELGDTIEPIRDGIRKIFEDAYVDTFFVSEKDVDRFYERTKERKEWKKIYSHR